MHSPTCDKVKVWSWLPSLIPLKTTRSMLAVRALIFVSVLSILSFQLVLVISPGIKHLQASNKENC